MQYMLMFYQPAAEFEQREDASSQAYRASWVAYADAVRQAGISLGGHGLFPPMTGTTLRVRGDKRQVQDGPFADTKEQLGGYFVVDVPNLDVALEWAARAPCATSGGVEVRPVFTATAVATSPLVSSALLCVLRVSAVRRCPNLRLVVLQPEMRDLIFTHQVTERVLQLRLLDEKIVFRLKSGSRHGRFVIEA